jgi:RNA polymerase sigma-70 factor (sigma-E family)
MGVDSEAVERFRVYVTERLPSLIRFGYVLTGEPDAAHDLVQSALERTFAAWARVRNTDDPEGYVRTTMVHLYANQKRRRAWRERATAELPDTALGSDSTASLDLRHSMWEALRRLPPRQRAVMVLRFYEDRSEVEVAGLLGCSVGTVKSQSAKAMVKLRGAVELSDAPDGEVRPV